MTQQPEWAPGKRPLFFTVLVIATCGLIYELVAGTLASYVLGDSVTQFSTVIGAYLFALGIGAYLSRFIEAQLAKRFVDVELAVALVGGLSAPFLFFAFSYGGAFRVVLYGVVLCVGTLVGLEIPLLLRLLEKSLKFKDLVSQVLTFDYLGSLGASVLFPLLLVPRLGLVRTSLFFGFVNALVGLWSTWLLAPMIQDVTLLRVRAVFTCALLLVAFAAGDVLTGFFEGGMYADEVIHARSSPYQRIVLTQGRRGLSLYLNGNLQFSSSDEYRYHEALVHPAMTRAADISDVLVLGGGDGLAVREVLKYPGVKTVTLVDLDPAMTSLPRDVEWLGELSAHSFEDPRVKIINEDAYRYLTDTTQQWSVAIVDFPDPNNFSLGKLYTRKFYELLRSRLTERGVAVIQSTSPLYARESFWIIERTIEAAGFQTAAYHALVPSFGEWGYVLASAPGAVSVERALPGGLRFISDETVGSMFEFPPDMARVPAQVNSLNNQVLVRTYEDEWRRWN